MDGVEKNIIFLPRGRLAECAARVRKRLGELAGGKVHVRRNVLKSKPREITVAEFDKALKEKFYVNTATAGVRVGFGNRLLIHMTHHSAADQERRKVKPLYAVSTVKSGKRKPNPQGGPGSWGYAKQSHSLKMVMYSFLDFFAMAESIPQAAKSRNRRALPPGFDAQGISEAGRGIDAFRS